MQTSLNETLIENTLRHHISETQALLFVEAIKHKYNIADFVKKYFNSDICKSIDSEYSYWQNEYYLRIFKFFTRSTKVKKTSKYQDEDRAYWLGYFYRQWHFITKENSKSILRFAPTIFTLNGYPLYHLLDVKASIQRIKEIYNLSRNSHRKYEFEHIGEKELPFENTKYMEFLAKDILFKFYNEERYKKLIYTKDVSPYTFEYESTSLNVAVVNDKNSIISIFKNENKRINDISKRKDIILFIFIDNNLHNFSYHQFIEELKTIQLSQRNFNYIYVYCLGNLFLLNNRNQLERFYINIKKGLKKSIIKEIK